MTDNTFQTGIAEVTGKSGPSVKVRCPHCRSIHHHDRRVIGSGEVVAGLFPGICRRPAVLGTAGMTATTYRRRERLRRNTCRDCGRTGGCLAITPTWPRQLLCDQCVTHRLVKE